MTDDQIRDLLVAVTGIAGRMDAIETARSLARGEQEAWRVEVREELHQIKDQVTTTNGRLRILEEWRARADGFRSAFSWAPSLVGGVLASGIVAGVIYLGSH